MHAYLSKPTCPVYFGYEANPSARVGEAPIPEGNTHIDILMAITIELKSKGPNVTLLSGR